MADSLRVRLLAWYAALLVVVIALVGAAVCAVTWRARLGAVDASLRARASVVAQAVQREAGGAFDVELPSEATAFFQDPHTRPYYAVWDSGGRLIDRSDPDVAGAELPPPGPRTAGTNREAVISASGGLTVLVGQDISDVWGELWSLAATMAGVALIGAAVSLGGAWFLAGRALAPVQRINDTARRMSQGDLTARIAIPRTDTELGQVASALNLAFDRMRESVERQRRFTADASHELRTPVATMMAELEWALLHDRAAADYKESLEVCQRAGARMQSLVEGLLMLARADSGQLPVRRSNVRLDRLVSEAAGLLRPLALQQQVTLLVTATAQTVTGDPDRLRELISNLLYNGISYNRPSGIVSIDVRLEHDHVVLRVADTGIGIDADDLPHVFERFYRGERARERAPSGAGLGLALAKWIVDAHGGTIECTSDLERGTEFIALFPASAAIGSQMPNQLDDEREIAMSGKIPE
jgi:two-component system, OmpR family, sensor kinase